MNLRTKKDEFKVSHGIKQKNNYFKSSGYKRLTNPIVPFNLSTNNALVINRRFKQLYNYPSYTKQYHTKINTFIGYKGLLAFFKILVSYVLDKIVYLIIRLVVLYKGLLSLLLHEVFIPLSYNIQKFSETYPLLYNRIVYVILLYKNMHKLLLTYQGLCLLFLVGLFIDRSCYFDYLLILSIITLFKNELINNKKILSKNPDSKEFLISLLSFVQEFLLLILLSIIAETFLTFLKRILSSILKMFGRGNNNSNNQGASGHSNNSNGNDPNNPNPNNTNTSVISKNESKERRRFAKERRRFEEEKRCFEENRDSYHPDDGEVVVTNE